MIAWRDEAARGVISETILMQLEKQYKAGWRNKIER
jgi:hypothetical protein